MLLPVAPSNMVNILYHLLCTQQSGCGLLLALGQPNVKSALQTPAVVNLASPQGTAPACLPVLTTKPTQGMRLV